MSGSIGDNVFRASGVIAAAAGGAIEWDTSIHTSTVTAESGKGYFVNTSGGAVTVNLPAASVGDIVAIKDYAGTFDTYPCTVAPNSSENIGGGNAADPTLDVEGESLTLVYADATQGWLATQQNVTTNPSGAQTFMAASGGDATLTVGDYKTHVFTGPGTFCVSSVSAETAANNSVDYLVIAGGGGGAAYAGGGGGAGGFRMANSLCLPSPTTSPLASPTGITVTASPYAIAIGAAGAANPGPSCGGVGGTGGTSSFAPITSAGGAGGEAGPNAVGNPGGSGSGAKGGPGPSDGYAGGAGNVPPTDPAQGTPGGAGFDGNATSTNGGGGGGAGAAGGDAAHAVGGTGGAGSYIADDYFGPTAPSYGEAGPASDTRYFAGGGGGGTCQTPPSTPSALGGVGGGGNGGYGPSPCATGGTTNMGGGGGGQRGANPSTGTGGSGIVTIRYKFQ